MISDLLRLRGLTATSQQKADARWLILGTLIGFALSGWGLLYPWARAIRGVLTTGMAESAMDRSARGDAGASIGILQFNDVRADLLSRRGWRLSPFWSGYAVARYLRATDSRVATLRPDMAGLAAWRATWVRGAPLAPGDTRDVGPIALIVWQNIGQRYAWVTVLQYAAMAAAIVLLPVLALPLLAIVAIGWLR